MVVEMIEELLLTFEPETLLGIEKLLRQSHPPYSFPGMGAEWTGKLFFPSRWPGTAKLQSDRSGHLFVAV